MRVALGFLIAAQLFSTPAMAVSAPVCAEPEYTVTISTEKEEPTRQEVFEWYYRMYNGHQQMRLWSVTYGRWVTDWIDCD